MWNFEKWMFHQTHDEELNEYIEILKGWKNQLNNILIDTVETERIITDKLSVIDNTIKQLENLVNDV